MTSADRVPCWCDHESHTQDWLYSLLRISPGAAAALVERARQVVDLGYSGEAADQLGPRPLLDLARGRVEGAAIDLRLQGPGYRDTARCDIIQAAALLIAALDTMHRQDAHQAEPAGDGAA
ncbi:hypothetical protein [uncultured Rhodospira sp.]|uniref:hypothetical protein n=1 Tax=uncultured Rhodospira sp. TaxID=1936189 RepID=UPI002609BC36|nr:hypothetical protein [uncultured Rhodospira sp.]